MLRSLFLTCFVALPVFAMGVAHAAPQIETLAKQAIVADVQTGTVLFEKEGYGQMFPASMTKMMTAHIVFEELKSSKLKMQDKLLVSEAAWRMGGSKMFVHVGDQVAVEDLLRGVVIQSGNDACLVFSEGLAGSEANFAARMNEEAKRIGMKDTHFVNSTGWPDPTHVTTPYDLFLLARDTIVNYPEYYPIYGEREFLYNGIRQPNRNLLLDRGVGVDGLKTGHTEASGYGITISGVNKEDGRRIIVVVNGLNSDKQRADEAQKLLLFAYRNFENRMLWKAGEEVVKADVWFGEMPSVPLVVKEDLFFAIPKGDSGKVKLSVTYTGPLQAPVAQGTQVGKLSITFPDSPVREVALYTGQAVEKLSPLQRIVPALQYYLTH